MATLTSSGVGSGLQVSSLVSQLVAAERAPADARILRTDTKLTTEFTALSRLKGAMSGFQASTSALKTKDAFELRKVVVGEGAGFTATATGASANATYDVEVRKLAKAQQLGSDPYLAGPDSVVGTGTLTISMGTKTFNVEIPDGKKTLAGIRDSINAATDNVGVRATLITDVEGTRLVLTGSATGAANGIKVATAGGNGGLAALAYDPVGVKSLEVVSPAQDAEVYVSGYKILSASNTISTAIDGVTLNLTKEETGKVASLTISRDDAGIKAKLDGFVTAYNALATQITSLRSYNAATETAGPLLGDSMVRNLESQLRRMVTESVPGLPATTSSLANIGITMQLDGTLKLDASKLNAALADNSTAVTALLTSESGVAVKLDSLLKSKLGTSSELAAREATITAKRRDLDKQKQAVDARMEVIQARYMKQFNALDTMLTQMQSTSSYLTQQFDALSNLNKS